MITLTARDLIVRTMRLIGVVASSEVPTFDEGIDGLNRLNELIDGWGLQRGTIMTTLRTVVPLVAGQPTYLIGLSGNGDVLIDRPVTLDYAALIQADSDPDTEIAVGQMTRAGYHSIPQKDTTGTLVSAVWYEPTIPDGTLWVYPTPTVALDLAIYTPKAITQFASLTDAISLPPGLAEAMRYNLAVMLAPEFGRQLDPTVYRRAQSSLEEVKRANQQMSDLAMDRALVGAGAYNIWTDS